MELLNGLEVSQSFDAQAYIIEAHDKPHKFLFSEMSHCTNLPNVVHHHGQPMTSQLMEAIPDKAKGLKHQVGTILCAF